MNKKLWKGVASTTLLAFGIAVLPMPAVAADFSSATATVVAQAKDNETLTMNQVIELAVVYNRTSETLKLQSDMLDLKEEMTSNDKRALEWTLNGTNEVKVPTELTTSINTVNGLLAATTPGTTDYYALSAQQAVLNQQLSSVYSAMDQVASAMDSMISGIDQYENGLDTLHDSQDDMKKAREDWTKEVRLIAEKMCTAYNQLDKSIALVEGQVALAEKSLQIAKIQEAQGMAITTDVPTAEAQLIQAQTSLSTLQEQMTVLKRSINVMIGRNQGSPLTITHIMNPPAAIETAPAYTQALIDKFVKANYNLKTMNRTLDQLVEDGDDWKLDSDEQKEYDLKIKEQKNSIRDQKETIANDLKALLAAINNDGAAYNAARKAYVTAKKTFEFAEMKYNVGLISQIEFMQAKMTLQNAELTYLDKGYTFHQDWRKYYALEQGITLQAY